MDKIKVSPVPFLSTVRVLWPPPWLGVRAGVPLRRGVHDARVPAEEVRGAEDTGLPVRALAAAVHLHKDIGRLAALEKIFTF